jgi:hypothetical protein
MTNQDSTLAAAVAGEDAAIYAYGVLGPHLTGIDLAIAQQAETDHRNLRDSVNGTLPSPAAPEVLYALPFPVTGRASALALAVTIEERTEVLWRAAVVAGDTAHRQVPLDALTAAAVRAGALRRAAGASPGTVPFPGLS